MTMSWKFAKEVDVASAVIPAKAGIQISMMQSDLEKRHEEKT